jgi:predicted nucleotidyltransferase
MNLPRYNPPMDRPVEPDAIGECAARALESVPGIAAAYLFGSAGRGEARERSDIDIAVLFPEKLDPRLGGPLDRMRDAVERACGRRCDLLDARAVPPDLFHRVLRDGQVLIDRDHPMRIAFEVQRRNEYFDLLPYLQEYRRGGRVA